MINKLKLFMENKFNKYFRHSWNNILIFLEM